MAKKFFQRMPSNLAGMIFVLGSMLDGITISQIIDSNGKLAVVLIALRAGISEFKTMYLAGLSVNTTKNE
jgi:hypothetical protein